MAGYGFNTGMDGHRVRPLSEADKEEIAEGLKIIYGNARERMLRNVSGRFARGITQHGWAERKANEVLAAHAQLERDMDRAHDQREKLLSGVMEGAYASGSQKFYSDMRSVLGETAHISPNSMKAGYILADLNNSLNASERRILRQFDDKYADIIGSVSSEMATGVMTTRQAVGEALIAFADEGIDGFVDRGGHHWTLENYAEMAVLTAIERSTISGYVDTMQEYGYDLAIIDGHAGACPICAAWEGVIVSVSGNDSDYPSLDDAENDGCFHPRCMHGITTYYPEISHTPIGGFRTEPREIPSEEPSYTARSKQRYMERMIRKYKDRAIVAQTQQQKMQAVNKVRQWEDALDDLIEEQPADNYLYRHRSRETGLQSAAAGSSMKVSTGGHRNERPLTEEQIRDCTDYAVSLGMPRDQIVYLENINTSYTGSVFDVLVIGTDAYPSGDTSRANYEMSNRAAIAHEVVGHRATCLHGTNKTSTPMDEAQASYRAARLAPGLSDDDRRLLEQDARDRLSAIGVNLDDVIDQFDMREE